MADIAQRHFYLCPPTYYEVEYAINDWMDLNNKVDHPLAESQWHELHRIYQELGVKVTLLDPVPGIPELVFPGDSIFLYGDQAVASRFRHSERDPEVEPKVEWFSQRGFTIRRLPEGLHFEGNAELIRWNDRFFGGYGVRSDAEVYDHLASLLGIDILALNLLPPFFHLDVLLLPLDAETVAYVPEAFDQRSCELIRSVVPNAIAVDLEEARQLGCNSMVVGRTVIMSTPRAPHFAAVLAANGFETIQLDLTEYFKSGGGVKCLTLEHYPAL